MQRPDETWHRLLKWTYGQAPSERLAAQILLAEGYTHLDPSHPLGGKDGGKDALCVKDGQTWLMAVYFPREQQGFGQIQTKFTGDFAGVAKNGAAGIAFVTNQELTLAERLEPLFANNAALEVPLRQLAVQVNQLRLAFWETEAASGGTVAQSALASCLGNCSVRLAAAGQRAGALAAIERVVQIHDDLARSRPAVYEPELAGSLASLARL